MARGHLPLLVLTAILLQLRKFSGVAATQQNAAAPVFGSCTSVRKGCYHDICGDDCSSTNRILSVYPAGCSSSDLAPGPCPDGTKKCGCDVCAAADDTCPPAKTPCPAKCTATQMTPQYCMQQCAEIGQRYFGVQFGHQCFCGNRIRNEKGAQTSVDTWQRDTACAVTPTFPGGCNGGGTNGESGCACTGKSGEACGGFGFMEIYEMNCSSALGSALAAAILLGGAVYVAGGVVLGRSSGRPALKAHPHWNKWLEIHALCWDGLAFVKRGGSVVGRELQSSREPLVQSFSKQDRRESDGSAKDGPKKPSHKSSKGSGKKRDKQSNSSKPSSSAKSDNGGGDNGQPEGAAAPTPADLLGRQDTAMTDAFGRSLKR